MEFSWALTLPREQSSVLLAGRLAGAAVIALSVSPSAAATMRENVQVGGGYLVAHSNAPFFRVRLGVRGTLCQVDITDKDFVLATSRKSEGPPDDRDEHAALRQLISRQLSVRADRVEVRHNAHDAILLRFQIPLFQGQPWPGPEF
ncbi:hypothetical protein [Streptomyces sp. KL118A]|uniref:hypothetical protein n=1 Tax=Streptomyces sp. KL118A TaxID=3045153 RepID=UPI00278C63D2|nr:hypothetical protein [Streptomyces sp. KL118A]